MERILLIDDEAVLLQVLGQRLEQHGYAVSRIADMATLQAFELPVQHIILDLKFGDQNGLHLIESLRQRFQPQQLIILTGYASIATSVAAIKAGATNYLAKPVSLGELLSCLRGSQPQLPEPAAQQLSPAQLEWELLQRTLQQHQGNISATARALGMHRRTLQRKLNKHSPIRS